MSDSGTTTAYVTSPAVASPAVGRASGAVWVHAAPRAVTSHVEWALARVLPGSQSLSWQPQPAVSGAVRCHAGWRGPVGTAARIASELRACDVRFEVTESPGPDSLGERFSFVPHLGMYRATIGPLGDVQLGEDRLRAALVARFAEGAQAIVEEVDTLLGGPWDRELEVFRSAAVGEPVRWLGATG